VPSSTSNGRTPTEVTYQAFQSAYDHLNSSLFSNTLPACLVTLQRHSRRTYGHFAPAKFRQTNGDDHTDEIAMNPQHFLERPAEEVLSTLAHEMVHNADVGIRFISGRHTSASRRARPTTTDNGRTK
jgi:hypothetical protein